MTPPQTDPRFATTLARGLGVLRAFRPTDRGLTNQEISRRTGLPPPTVSRLCYTLCALGYLTHGRKHGKYRLGPATLALGNIAAAAFSFVDAAAPDLQRLADETGTLIGIAIADDGRMLLTRTWRPQGSASIWLEPGYRMPVAASSSGKAYLAGATDAEYDRLCALLAERGEADVQALQVLRQEALDEFATRGFARLGGDAHFSAAINSAAVPCRPREFGAAVVFFSGATYDDCPAERMTDTVGPALARTVAGLRDRDF